ncbi:AAA family ATPase [Leptolyngbya sp. CCNP1308]|uniref:AAA family ATPase n=1 Tax=Leptolyngbya sp. CCNP1308 TaxID=3110255 RepID=UPI002B218E0D|nr:AAA family ATPase [Leptolyngbya sp. CCNP1308]MEA5448464.1 AAA family ATPase [Leptolyngbya sp. CCNP1308]
MKDCVIGFSGQIGSGKSTLAKATANEFCWPCLSFGHYVRSMAEKRGLNMSRETLQLLGSELVESDPRQFCESALSELQWQARQPLIVEGIRHVVILNILKEICSPLGFYLVFVTVQKNLHTERILNRDQHITPQYIEQDFTEVQVQTQLKQHADLIIRNDRPKDIVIREMLELFKRMK